MSVLSKILQPEWNLPYNCYELGHTWTPYCSEAALEIGLITFKQSLKLYLPLYVMNQLVFQRKYDTETWKATVKNIVRSSTFLGMNGFLVILLFCLSRQLMGRFYYSLCATIPSFIGSYCAILIEGVSRRKALAFYVANIASESFYRTMVSRGYFRPVPNGKYILFALSTSILVYLFQQKQLQDPFVRFLFGIILGKASSKSDSKVMFDIENIPASTSKASLQSLFPLSSSSSSSSPSSSSSSSSLSSVVGIITDALRSILPFSSTAHRLCDHSELGCLEDILINGTLKPFMLGWTAQLLMGSVPRILTLKSGALQNTLLNPEYILSSKRTRFGLFLGTFITIYKIIRCSTRHITDHDPPSSAFFAALAASPAHFLAPSTSVTLYLVWKAAESLFTIGAKRGLIPGDKFFVTIIYALSCSQLFYASILDPKQIKGSYIKFLDRVTENKLQQVNRNVLEVFGTSATNGYHTFMPQYQLEFTTRRFQESVLAWLL